MMYQYGIGILIGSSAILISGEPAISHFNNVALFVNLFYAACMLSTNWLCLYGFKHCDVKVGGIILSIEIPATVIVGLIAYSEHPNQGAWIGIALIMCGALASCWPAPTRIVELPAKSVPSM